MEQKHQKPISPEVAEARHQTGDANGDGKLTTEEFLSALEQKDNKTIDRMFDKHFAAALVMWHTHDQDARADGLSDAERKPFDDNFHAFLQTATNAYLAKLHNWENPSQLSAADMQRMQAIKHIEIPQDIARLAKAAAGVLLDRCTMREGDERPICIVPATPAERGQTPT